MQRGLGGFYAKFNLATHTPPSLLINKKASKNLILVNAQYRDGYLFGYNLIKKMKPRKSRNLNKKNQEKGSSCLHPRYIYIKQIITKMAIFFLYKGVIIFLIFLDFLMYLCKK
jgi:hypothetical protein